MAFKPLVRTTGSTAIEAISYDGERDNVTITNLSGETCYISPDPDVKASGSTQGEPIFNNGRFEANATNGRDPRLARWVIGSAGGTIIIGFEYYKNDPLRLLLNEIKEQNDQLMTVIRAVVLPYGDGRVGNGKL